MGISLVYLGKNDKDKEMYRMCEAIAAKLTRTNIEVQQTNLNDGNNLPAPNTVRFEEVWFCGHSRFVEANASIRKTSERDLGGFPVSDVSLFIKSSVARGKDKFRLICCESAQQQRYTPKLVGQPPEDFAGVLGNVLLQNLIDVRPLHQFNTTIDARVSHLEGLILAMAELWRQGKQSQPAFEICGLWGAGDITADDVPITSFLQDGGSLNAQEKMNDEKLSEQKRKTFATTFDNAHCSKKGLPDFFGYRIAQDLLVKWVPSQV